LLNGVDAALPQPVYDNELNLEYHSIINQLDSNLPNGIFRDDSVSSAILTKVYDPNAPCSG